MEDLKTNRKGITLVVLIITIVIMLILTTVTIQVGTGSIENSRMMSFLAYMQAIQSKVDIIDEYDNYLNYGEALSSSNESKLQAILDSETENFLTTTSSESLRYFDSNHIASDLEIKNIDDEIVINFETREVISLNGIKYEDKMYYTQYYLPGGQKINNQTEEISRTVSLGEITANINGLNATITVNNISITNGTLCYGIKKNTDEIKWTEITSYTKKDDIITTMNITESGVYYFKLIDNINGSDNANTEGTYPALEIRLTNSPKLQGNLTDLSTSYNYSNLGDSTKWAFATDKTDTANLKYYVWIPRFVYKLKADNTLDELQFLRGTSDITTTGEYINSEWTEPDVFTSGANKLTGVWVKVNSPNQARIDIIDVLNSGTIL